MLTMGLSRRRFTMAEKQDILQQADHEGIMVVLRKYNLSYSVFYRWKKNLSEDSSLQARKHVSPGSSQIQELEEENALLKKIIANQAMLLELKEDELRKSKM